MISIIALLIAILLPALKSARESARGIQCGSNLRQVGIAQFVYAQDFSWFAPGRAGVNPPDVQYIYGTGNWDHLLRRYMNGPATISNWTESTAWSQSGANWCPSTEKYGTGVDTRSYAPSNFNLMGDTGDLLPSKPLTVGEEMYLVRPDTIYRHAIGSKILFVSELGANPSGPGGGTRFIIRNQGFWVGSFADTTPAFRHNEAKNVLFLDGHVEMLKATANMNWALYLN